MQNTQAINVKAGSAVATGSVTVSDSMPGVPCPDPAGYKYVGARYVPLFADPAEWNINNTYEPLTIVLNEGNSYTSKQYVPVGIQIDNEEYWAQTGNYNAQVELYRQEVEALKEQVDFIYPTTTLVDDDLPVNTTVRTFGYAAIGDGGECFFKVSASSESAVDIAKGSVFLTPIPSNNTMNSKCVGCFPTASDQTELINNLAKFSGENDTKITFDSGTYYASVINITTNKASFIGNTGIREYSEVTFTPYGTTGTTFLTVDCDYCTLENLNFIESSVAARTTGLNISSIFGSFKHLFIEGFDKSIIIHDMFNATVDDIYCKNMRKVGYMQNGVVNNLLASNVHCTSTATTPSYNFSLISGNSSTLLNVTSEGNAPIHFEIGVAAFGISLINPHCESGKTLIDVEGSNTYPEGTINIIGGIYTPNVNSITTEKFITGAMLDRLNVIGLYVNPYSDDKFLPSKYFSMSNVANLLHSISFYPVNYTGAYGTQPIRIYNGSGLNTQFPISTIGTNTGYNGGTPYYYGGKSNEIGTNIVVAGASASTPQTVLTWELNKQFAVNVKVFQNYYSTSEQQYSEYMVMISENGTLLQKEIVSSGHFNLTFTYSDNELKFTSDEQYGNYNFNITVYTLSER